jgi:thioredoxin-related protein
MKTSRYSLIVSLFLLLGLQGLALAQDSKWLTDYQKALAQAKAENKAVLMDFTGSDWCPWCIKMDKDVLDKQEFKDYADKNLVLVEVDFPNSKPQTDEVKKQNEELKGKYDAEGFPTFIMVDADGKELGRQVGFLPGGPSAFIAKLTSFKKS